MQTSGGERRMENRSKVKIIYCLLKTCHDYHATKNCYDDSHFHHNHHHHHHQHIIIWQTPEWLEEVTTLWLLFPSLFCLSANWGHFRQYCHRIWKLLQFSTSPFKFCRQYPKYGTYRFRSKQTWNIKNYQTMKENVSISQR